MLKLVDAIKSSKGISLMEVMIAMAIGLIGAMGGYAILASMDSTRVENTAVVVAQGEARNILERMTRELRESSPEVVWPRYDTNGAEYNWVYFLTPRNADREFIINTEGEPEWQRGIQYWLNKDSNTLYRFRFYLTFDPDADDWSNWFQFEIVSENVEELTFSRDDDMFTINIRTFSHSDGGLGNVARSYVDLSTTIKLRN